MALPSWVPDAETKPAPMPLLVVQSFVNTWEADSGVDLLADPASASRWLRDAGLIGPDAEDVDDALARGGAGEHPSPPRAQRERWAPDPSGPAALDALAETCRFRAGVLPDGTVELRPEAGGVPGVGRRSSSSSATRNATAPGDA